ncbi:MAG: S-adenosylmethionine decarboxylase [Nanoarchaeota archaeon]
MVQTFHSIYEISSCSSINEPAAVESLMRKISGALASRILKGPFVISRQFGYVGKTGLTVMEAGHIVVHTFSSVKEAVIEVYAYNLFDELAIKNVISSSLGINSASVRLKKTGSGDRSESSFPECEEVSCTRKAARTWGGRNVCQDHYERYKELLEKDLHSMNEY